VASHSKSGTGRLIDALIVIVVLGFVLGALTDMVRPYVPWILLAGFIYAMYRTWLARRY
jgi:F0F1-type ATP synthase assembly protein I